ncbi:MAG: DUF169 domain-containing protein [Syntrophomonadaceae bacterium]|nr:DUF169 domain-containing protein [Syntrophomonadaceae bacterium]
MGIWKEMSQELKTELCLRTEPIGFRVLQKAEELDQIPRMMRWKATCAFCQIPYLVRAQGLTIGVTREDGMLDRCKRIHGLLATDEQSMKEEAASLALTWMPSPEEAVRQQQDYYRIPPGEAIVLAPLVKEKFEPEVVLVYGTPTQIMMAMCAMQKVKYEKFNFHFIGEGACSDSLAQCYVTNKPALGIPCAGERTMGQVAEDEIVIALPPGEVERVLKGFKILRKVGFKYPLVNIGGATDPSPALAAFYK